MAELSPAAQAVLDAAAKAVLAHPRLNLEHIAAAALRAAADQVVPEEQTIPDGDLTEQAYRSDERAGVRRDTLAIAAELEALPND
jgi:hypothetical protein